MHAPQLARALSPRAAVRLTLGRAAATTAAPPRRPPPQPRAASSAAVRPAARPVAKSATTAAPASATATVTRPLHVSSRGGARAVSKPTPTSAQDSSPLPSAAAAASTASTASATDAAADVADVPPMPMPMPAAPAATASADPPVDWSSSFQGLSTAPFAPEVAAVLMAPVDAQDVEIKPDGILYLPEIKYRRILNAAFGPGGWGLAPRDALAVGDKIVSREFALVVQGRFVGLARGECAYFGGADGVATAGEGCKSNALMRCCKDLGVASELWDPRFIRRFKQQHCREVWVEHVLTKKKRQIWLRKDTAPAYPYAATTSSR